MKISDVIAWFKQREQWFQHEGQPWGAMAAQCKANREALEQHHKDLMVLVKAWRNRLVSDDCMDYKEGFYQAMEDCSSELKSLINPKD